MKLQFSGGSQFVRKVMATAIEGGVLDRIELIKDKKDLATHNPLLKRPAMVTDDGDFINSPVICEYVDSIAGNKVIPAKGRERWKALSLEALADGVMDAATAIRHDQAYHKGHESKEWFDRQMLKVIQGIDAFEAQADAGEYDGVVSIGTITVGILCAFLDNRFPELEWRKTRPALAEWYETFSKRPSMVKTTPKAD